MADNLQQIQISIIVPIYNVEKYLEECLDSIAGKHEEVVEILLIDDGSTDNSGVIAENYANLYKNIFLYHKVNGGLSDARNYGIWRARGKYVLFLDSDDFISDDALDIILFECINNQLDIILWDANVVDDNRNKITENNFYCHNGLNNNCISSGKEILKRQILARNDYPATVWLGLYNREYLISNNFWFENGLLHEDEFWTPKVLIEAEAVKYLKESIYYYRLSQNSIMRRHDHDYSRNIECIIYIYSSMLVYYDWKLKDSELCKLLKGNIVKKYLHVIGKYNIYKYPFLKKKINRLELLLNATTINDKLKALILLINTRIYCLIMNVSHININYNED